LPGRYVNQGFWLIETPGKRGKFKARVIAKIRFSSFKQYQSASDFYTDSHLHKIKEDDPDYGWKEDVAKYGWIVGDVEGVNEFRPPSPRGIVYTSPFGLEAGI
jgi:hypothetical protein